MSQRVVGYEGEGRQRRPVYDDDGPSSAAARDPIAMHASGGLPHLAVPTGGAGPIERRLISEAERAVRAEVRPSPIAPRPKGQASHKPGHPWAMPKRAPSPAPEEEAAMVDPLPVETPEPEPPSVGLAALADAVVEAMEAEGELAQAEVLLELARLRWTQARAALDAAYRALDASPPAVESGADHAEAIPEPAVAVPSPAADARRRAVELTSAAAAKADGAMAPFQRRMVDALLETNGDRAAAAARLGIKRASLEGSLGKVRKRTDLTEAERAVLGGRKAAI